MTDEPGRFVDDQQVGVLVNDFKKFFQARDSLSAGGHSVKPRQAPPRGRIVMREWTRIFQSAEGKMMNLKVPGHISTRLTPYSSYCIRRSRKAAVPPVRPGFGFRVDWRRPGNREIHLLLGHVNKVDKILLTPRLSQE